MFVKIFQGWWSEKRQFFLFAFKAVTNLNPVKSDDLSSKGDSLEHARLYVPRICSGVRANGRWRSGEIDRWDWWDQRRRRGIFAIPIPSSTSSLARNLHLHPSYLLHALPKDVDVSRVTSPAAECPTMDGRESDTGSRYTDTFVTDFSRFSTRG